MSTIDTLNVAVIGGGITGVTTAYGLARRGCRVTLFDRQPYAAMETSFANGASSQPRTRRSGTAGPRC